IMRQIETVKMETLMEIEAMTHEAVVEGRHTLIVCARRRFILDAMEDTDEDDAEAYCPMSEKADNKRRMDNNPRDNHTQQPPYKRQNVARAYTDWPSEKKEYAGTLPLCNKCKLHHNGPCIVKCTNCKKGECLILKNLNCENQTGNDEARGRVYALGGGEADQDPDNIADAIEV
nr:reverse transcriptase domain-containing protein [Tanacetum cinerariifolium]